MTLRIGVVGTLLLSGCLAANLETKSVIADLSYGDDPRPQPTAKLEFQLFATLQYDVMGPWHDPVAVARCFEALPPEALHTIGTAVAGTLNANEWAAHAWPAVDAALTPLAPCASLLTGPDGVQLVWSTAKAAGSIADFVNLTWLSSQRREETWGLAAAALHRHGRTLALTPPAQVAQNDLPVLALSGGAANGAFTAGFLYELLSTREAALATLPEADREAADAQSRFAAVVGTSVGAVLSQLLDFLWAEEGPLTPPQQAFLDACNADPLDTALAAPRTSSTDCFSGGPASPFPTLPMPSSPRRTCALKMMLKYFADSDETELLCAEPGSVTRALGFLGSPTLNLMRFDPLQNAPMSPMLENFGEAMSKNGLSRVTVAVEAQQSQLLGLDERACGADDKSWCLSSGVMASAVMPGFARPVTHAWSGFEEKGECGVWFDGGMRSGLPVLRALSLSRGTPLLSTPRPGAPLRVLGLDTGRLTSNPMPAPAILVDVAMGALEQLYTQNGTGELSLAQTAAELRDTELQALVDLMRPVLARSANQRLRAQDPRVRALFVPSDVPDWIVVGAGYAFDRSVMRGLFLWGRELARVQLTNQQLGQSLGWPLADAMQRLEEQREDPAYDSWLDAYKAPTMCPAFAKWRLETGAERVKEHMVSCEDRPSKRPPYFSCPAGTWNAGGVQ